MPICEVCGKSAETVKTCVLCRVKFGPCCKADEDESICYDCQEINNEETEDIDEDVYEDEDEDDEEEDEDPREDEWKDDGRETE